MTPPASRSGPRVVLLGSQLDAVGGIPRYTHWLYEALDEVGAVDLVDLGLNGTLIGRVRAAARAVTALRARPQLLVLAHPSLWPIGLLYRGLGVPSVSLAYGIDVWGEPRPFFSWGLRRLSGVWPISAFTATQLRERHCVRRLAPPLGGAIEQRFFDVQPEPSLPFRVVLVGRLQALSHKGVDVAIEATHRLSKTHPIELRIVGTGPAKDELLAMLARSPAPAIALGQVDDAGLVEEYRRAGVVLLVSSHRAGHEPLGEGLGITLLEAGAAAVPGIAARIGGSTDAIIDGQTGFLIDAGSVDALAGAVEALLTDPQRASVMGMSARAFVDSEHSAAVFAARVRSAVDAVLGDSRGRRRHRRTDAVRA